VSDRDRATIAALKLALQKAASEARLYHASLSEYGALATERRTALAADLARWRAMAAPGWTAGPGKVLVHADGGDCHGRAIIDGICSGCGIAPDMQSTEFWDLDEPRTIAAVEDLRAIRGQR
jgi:hypothetical protein